MISPKEILSTKSFRQSSITIASTVINGALGAIFYFSLARFLGSAGFGVFSIIATTIALLVGLVDLGTDQGIVRFVPKYKGDPETQNKFIKLALETKFLTGFVVFLAVLIFSSQTANFVFNKNELVLVMPLIGIGVLTQLLFNFSTTLSQSLEKYFLWGGLFVGTNLFRLLAILALYFYGSLTAYTSGILYILLPFLGFIFSFLFLNKKFFFAKDEISSLKEVLGFNKWVVAFIVVSTIGARLDIYFTARFLSLSALGVYGLAIQVSQILPQLTAAISAVTSPKFSSFDSKEKNYIYTFKATSMTSVAALGSAFVLLIFGPFVFSFAGKDFSGAFTPLAILLAAMAIFLSTSPIRDSILYFFGKPRFFFWQGITYVLIVSISSFYLIPSYSIIGSSLVVLIGQIFIAISSVWYFLVKMHHA